MEPYNIYYPPPKPKPRVSISIKELIKQHQMKTKPNFKTEINASGTTLQGYIDITYDDLVKVLGKEEGGGDKTLAEWSIEFDNGIIATIYDWKNTGWKKEDVTNWHIGGYDGKCIDMIQQLFDDHFVTRHINPYIFYTI